MPLTIKPQIEKHGKEEIEVLCKRIGYIPHEHSEGTSFIPLGFILLQIIVTNGKDEYKIKWNNKSGMPGRINLHYPDTMTYPTFTTGKGKTRKVHFDYSAKQKVKKGEKFMFNTVEELVEDFKWLAHMKDQIKNLFIEKIIESAKG